MRDHLEIITRTQAACKKWFKYRAGRITASNLHAVVHTSPQQPSIYLLRNICYPDVYSFKSDATEWGCLHEKEALEAYKSESPHLGCSPDGLVSCTSHGLGIVEVKCPYSARNMTVNDAAESNSDFCLNLKDGNLHLKNTHSYYYQCQLQLYVTKYRYCDFVVWTTQSIHIERLHVDGELLETFYELPSIFSSTVFYLNYYQNGIHVCTVWLFQQLTETIGKLMMKMMDLGAIVKKTLIIKHAQISGTTSCA